MTSYPGKTIEESGIMLHMFYIHYRCYRLEVRHPLRLSMHYTLQIKTRL